MYNVELAYRSRLGNLTATMHSHAILATRAEADELREALRAEPGLEQATVKITIAKPLHTTVDDALDHFRAEIREYPPIRENQNAGA
jgi:hypothetical protein